MQWAIEDKSISDTDRVLEYFTRADAWKNGSIRGNIALLVRRYAAEGTSQGYDACLRLLRSAPAAELEPILQALNRGLAERSAVLGEIGPGGLFDSFASVQKSTSSGLQRNFEPLTPALKKSIEDLWQASRREPLCLQLAIRAGIDGAHDQVLELLADPKSKPETRLAMLAILDELGSDDCVSVVLRLIDREQSEAVQVAALGVLARSSDEAIGNKILANYPHMSPSLQYRSRDILFSRLASTHAFLKLVDQGHISPMEVPLDQLRRASLHGDESINALVRKHWGNIQPGTPEEKLAVMRRLNNDLRGGSGDRKQGLELFTKHCGTCHRLFGDGGDVGPDLTAANRGDRDALLANLVDPSAVIRSQYLSYIVATTGGEVLTGVIAEQDAASITLLDAKNQRVKVARNRIDEIKESSVSIMPDNLIEQLTPQQLRDLFSYLQSDAKPVIGERCAVSGKR